MAERPTNVPAQLLGVIDTIFPVEIVGTGRMRKRIFWLSEVPTGNRKYPQTWQIELWHDDTEDVLMHKVGDAVRCTVEVRGARWTPKGGNQEKIITNLRCYKIEKVSPNDVL